ncbi:MAG: hypothetical protein GY701_36240 [Sulfitobacter sp.]|nr:hypothetical protein [Sulfitobacter sp.]
MTLSEMLANLAMSSHAFESKAAAAWDADKEAIDQWAAEQEPKWEESKARFQAWVDEQDAKTSQAIATLTANWDERVATIKTEWAEYKTQTAQADATEKAAKAEAYAGAAVKFAADTQHHAEEAIVQAALARAEARDA